MGTDRSDSEQPSGVGDSQMDEQTVAEGDKKRLEVLWQAPSLMAKYESATKKVDLAACVGFGGIWIAFLGAAPVLSVASFGVLLCIGTANVLAAHQWSTSDLRVHLRRNVTGITCTAESFKTRTLVFTSDGGATRTLHLKSTTYSDQRPPFSELIGHGGTGTFLNRSTGTSSVPERLDEVLASPFVIDTEDIEISSLLDYESQADALGTVSWLSRISREELEVKKSLKSPEAVLEHIGIQAQWISLVVLATGFGFGFGRELKNESKSRADKYPKISAGILEASSGMVQEMRG
eukprot:CAMPEP_0194516056 /NCGR_PEP_ID=MMETSP0253-20130528/48842_1 /TAXON_ID=2966 /ORGANISM="Noctiluca scintillans" /LENGTH=291 /DNA_ID=CAMNT_0039359867 /DNA_START=207 /DNA_END=1079 /DNA_ORIENTATION=-